MKKILMLPIFLFSISVFATENINIYGKLGLDIHSRFSNTSDIDPEDGFEYGLGYPKKGKIGYGLFLEATKNMTSKLELGLGVGYIQRKGTNASHLSGDSYSHGIGPTQVGKTHDYYKAERYSSFPLYMTLKYNFDVESDFKPYIKADLGYSFNKIKSSMNVKQIEYINGVQNSEDQYSVGLKVKNGLYTGIGVGVEYNNFLAELSYVHTSAKLNATYTGSDFSTGSETRTYKQNNSAVRLLIGYKFSY